MPLAYMYEPTGPIAPGVQRGVIFDFGGVISPPVGPILAEVEQEHGLPRGFLETVLYEGEPWTAAEVGELNYDQYVRACKRRIREFVSSEAQATDVWASWYRRYYRPEYTPGVIEIVRGLQGQARLAILSNALEGAERRWGIEFDLIYLFDALLSSAALRVTKPDPMAFQFAMTSLGLSPEHCFFTDDSPANVKAAEELGMRAHLFVDAEGLRLALLRDGFAL